MSSVLVADLVSALQHDVVPVAVYGDPRQAVRGVELLDRQAGESGGTGQLLLGVGLNTDSRTDTDSALRIAADSASVLAVKCSGDLPGDFRDRAGAAGVTIVAINSRMQWSRILRLASTLLATHPGGEPANPASGGDLFALANSVAAAVGGAVAIMDTNQVIVAYSNLPDQPIDETRRRGILGRRVPVEAGSDHLDREVWSSNSVVRQHREGDLPRLAVVIRAGEEVLGSLWVVCPDQGPTLDCETTMQQAARIAALHMLVLRRQVDADQDGRNRAFRAALDQNGSDPVNVRLPAVLLGADVPRAAHRHSTNLRRMLDLFGLDGRALGHQPAVALSNDRIYALLPTASPGTVPVDALIAHLRGRVERTLHLEITVSSSNEIATAEALRRERIDVDTALDHLRDTGAEPGHYPTERLRVELVHKRLVDTIRADPLLRSGVGERITAHDREHSTEFASTMLAYLREFGDVSAASADLLIHQNTLRQRLRRVQELFDIDLGNSAQRLLLELELAAASDVQ